MIPISVGRERETGVKDLSGDPVFGILERGGKVQVEVMQDVPEETLLTMAIKNVKRVA
jgi:hypothetical protein